MTETMALHPFTDERLAPVLARLLGESGVCAGPVRIARRRRNVFSSTYPSEIIDCDLGRGRAVSVFCKYGEPDAEADGSHRSGLEYEAAVYDRVLRGRGLAAPVYYGLARDGGRLVLALEYRDHAFRLHKAKEPAAILTAAARLGSFHALGVPSICEGGCEFLLRYDETYYADCARRVQERMGEPHLRREYPWVDGVCERFRNAAGELSAVPPVVIHGECYPKNILVDGGEPCFVDWQSAAVAPGEIDLASLTENWGERVERECRGVYESARWPRGVPAGADTRFALAQMYWHLRWLGGSRLREDAAGFAWRCSALRLAAARLASLG